MARKINIITVGKSHDAFLVDAIALYKKRLHAHFRVDWCLLPPKQEATIADSIASESNTILRTLEKAEYVIVCDERGEAVSSEKFSKMVFDALASCNNIYFVIGGAHGVDEHVRARANKIISFGSMVLPHQLMRLVLIEQLYRAATIASGGSYHHA
jgi:23S rRNA (pseudouridine1915-N3)-methyltransferase